MRIAFAFNVATKNMFVFPSKAYAPTHHGMLMNLLWRPAVWDFRYIFFSFFWNVCAQFEGKRDVINTKKKYWTNLNEFFFKTQLQLLAVLQDISFSSQNSTDTRHILYYFWGIIGNLGDVLGWRFERNGLGMWVLVLKINENSFANYSPQLRSFVITCNSGTFLRIIWKASRKFGECIPWG